MTNKIDNFRDRVKKKKADKSVAKNIKEHIECEYFEEITYECPVRGKVVEKVKVTRLKAQKSPDKKLMYEYDFLNDDEDVSDEELVF
jgi:hypothetical protein